MRIRDRAPLHGDFVAEQKYFKIVSQPRGKTRLAPAERRRFWAGHRRTDEAGAQRAKIAAVLDRLRGSAGHR